MIAGAPPDVTVVTVTYDAGELVRTCLDSLAAQRLGDLRMEVVVVDNASHDGTADLVARDYPWVRLVRAPRNLGFAAGNNLALHEVRSRHVVLVNNDAVVRPDTVRSLVTALDEAPDEVAAVAATVLLAQRFRRATAAEAGAAGTVHGPDGTWVPDPAGDVRLVNSTGNEVTTSGYGTDRGWLTDAARHAPPRDVFGFSGAAAALRVAALRDVGLFDESFFMYYEDTDLSWRLRLAGYRVEHCPEAVVEHVHAASSGEGSTFFRFHDTRNRLALLAKDASTGLLVRAVVRDVLTTVSLAVRRGRWEVAAVRARALGSWLRMLPALLGERRRLGRDARVARHQVETLLVAPTRGYSYRS